jgi:DNA-binding NarL/FixJ family response regulator
MTTIILADDHNLVREGLKHLLKDEATFRLIGEAKDGLEAVQLTEKLRPHVLLLDLMLPRLHGLEVIRQVRQSTSAQVIIVSMYADEPYIVEAFRNGASGYVPKDSTGSELLQAIRSVMSGNRYLSPAISNVPISAYMRRMDNGGKDVYHSLTARERVVLQLAAEGHSTAHIAKELFISPRTVETHRANVMRKLTLRSQTDLVRFAIRKKIIDA